MSKILRHLATWQPRLSKPQQSLRGVITECIWWEDVQSMEFADNFVAATLILGRSRSLSNGLVAINQALFGEVRRSEVDAFDKDPVWASVQDRFRLKLLERFEPVVAKAALNVFVEVVRTDFFFERYRPGVDIMRTKGITPFLQACMIGNYPFAVTGKLGHPGTVHLLCA